MSASDYLIVGGGTAGCIVAARLSENPDVTVTVIEPGPSDADEPRALDIRRWPEMLEGEYDFDYRSVAQQRGNSNIRQARMHILGGCSTANTMITWRPLAADLDEWVTLGAQGWDSAALNPYYDKIAAPITPVAAADRNPYVADVVASARRALDLPARTTWNSDPDFARTGVGAGFFEIGYTPETHLRSSTSVHYLHDIMCTRPNLRLMHGLQAVRVLIQNGAAVGVLARGADGVKSELRAAREVVLCCGAIDTPKLLQLSGIGPAKVLHDAGVDVLVDTPGVGENLMDHAEGLIVWEARREVPDICATGWDAGAAVRLHNDGPARPDVLMHFPVEAVAVHALTYGIDLPDDIVAIAPNVAKPRSRGRVWITTADPRVAPSIDYRYFTDPDGADEANLIAGIRLARRIAAQPPMSDWIGSEVFPGADLSTDEELSEPLRATHQTVYHVSGTCRMGAADDPMTVLDPRLRVRGVRNLRVVDASVFPTIPSVNPVGTIMAVAERASDLIAEDAESRDRTTVGVR